ncbi:hypothetical protein DSO57_1007106 [Entomophthora muscae]|uniref:Uncharacterized protein n=1 Tax=Entomophthora muscae TaxID=34485 RepID=A0ACC2TV67_9FUNG|nr:hypothetical protein DSO57_1007106 [Entomophthora muscae]
MELPVTPKPMPDSLPNLPTDYTGKLFGIVYITLTGVIDTIIPASSPWSWVRKSVSYLFKLAPLLWWALPTKTPAQVTPENDGPATRDCIPETEVYMAMEEHQVLKKVTTFYNKVSMLYVSAAD